LDVNSDNLKLRNLLLQLSNAGFAGLLFVGIVIFKNCNVNPGKFEIGRAVLIAYFWRSKQDRNFRIQKKSHETF
jgi:hypothetical protein